MEVRAPRSVDPTEATVLSPAANAPHADVFRVATTETVAGYKGYLSAPRGRRGRLGILDRKLDTGQLTVKLLDRRLGASNLARWLTGFLGNASGVHQLAGCKVLLRRSIDGGATFADWWTARIARIQKAGAVDYEIILREMTDDLGFDIFVGQPHESVRQKQGFGNATSASATFTIPSTSRDQFSAKDVGKRIVIAKAGTGGVDLDTTIAGFTSATSITLGTTAGATVAGAKWRAGYAIMSCYLPAGQAGDYGTVSAAFTLTGKINPSKYLTGRKAILLSTTTQLNPLAGSINLIADALLDTDVPVYEAQSFKPALLKWSEQIFAYVATTGAEKALQLGGVLTAAATSSVGSVLGITGAELIVQAIADVTDPDYLALPADGTTVTVQVRPRQLKPTEDMPIWLNDVNAGELWRDILDGDFSFLYTAAEKAAGLVPGGKAIGDQKRSFPYNAAAFATMIADPSIPKLRFRIDRREKANEFIEKQICLATGYAMRLNAQGEIVPVDLRLTSVSLTGVPTLVDADVITADGLEWSHGREGALTKVQATFYEDVEITFGKLLSATTARQGSIGAIAGTVAAGSKTPGLPTGRIVSRDRILLVADYGRLDLGEGGIELDLQGYRSGENELLAGVNRAQAIEADIVKLLADLKGPFGSGPNEVSITCANDSVTAAGLTIGSLVLASLSKLPDPATNLFGGTRALRVIGIADETLPITLDLLDLGPNVIAVAPVLGALGAGADTKHQITAALTLNAASDPIAVDIAITATSVGSAPAETAASWKRFATIYATGTITLSNLPAGMRVWVRARSEPRATLQGRIPSAWTFSTGADFQDTATVSAPSALAVTLVTTLSAQLDWTNGDATLWIELWLGSPSTDVTSLAYLLPPGTKTWKILGTVAADTYKAEVRATDRMGGFSAFATAVTWTASGTPADAPILGGLSVTQGA